MTLYDKPNSAILLTVTMVTGSAGTWQGAAERTDCIFVAKLFFDSDLTISVFAIPKGFQAVGFGP